MRARIVVLSLDDDIPSDSYKRPALLRRPDDYAFFARASDAGGGVRPFYADGKMQDERCGELIDALANDLLRKVGPGRGPISTIELVWSKSLTDMAARFAVPLEPIFRANDESVALLG